MKIGFFKIYITYTLLSIFILSKVASLHVITHDENVEDCEICYVATINNLTPIINNAPQHDINNDSESYFQLEIIDYYDFTYRSTINFTNLFSRPPPALT